MEDGFRKAAVLVSSLDRASADAILEQLGPEQARRVRQQMVDLGDVDAAEQRRVLDEFFRAGPRVPKPQPAGIELDGRLAEIYAASARPGPSRTPRTESQGPMRPPFAAWTAADADKLSRVLAGERPQIIALVLSQLPPEQASNVLGRLQPALQTDVIHRLVDLEETDPSTLAELERALQSRLSQPIHMQGHRVAGMEALAGILEAADRDTSRQIRANLAAHDRLLAERLAPETVDFSDLTELDDAGLVAVFRAVDSELAMAALIGAPPRLVSRILQRFPAAEAATIRRSLDHPGPIRLRDVEDARQRIAEKARQLAVEGRIRLAQPAMPLAS